MSVHCRFSWENKVACRVSLRVGCLQIQLVDISWSQNSSPKCNVATLSTAECPLNRQVIWDPPLYMHCARLSGKSINRPVAPCGSQVGVDITWERRRGSFDGVHEDPHAAISGTCLSRLTGALVSVRVGLWLQAVTDHDTMLKRVLYRSSMAH